MKLYPLPLTEALKAPTERYFENFVLKKNEICLFWSAQILVVISDESNSICLIEGVISTSCGRLAERKSYGAKGKAQE